MTAFDGSIGERIRCFTESQPDDIQPAEELTPLQHGGRDDLLTEHLGDAPLIELTDDVALLLGGQRPRAGPRRIVGEVADGLAEVLQRDLYRVEQGREGALALSTQEIVLADEVAKVVQDVVDRPGEPEQILSVDGRHQALRQECNELASFVIPPVLDLTDEVASFLRREVLLGCCARQPDPIEGSADLPGEARSDLGTAATGEVT